MENQKILTNLTYTADGTFDADTESMDLDLIIPAESQLPDHDRYLFNYLDLSRNLAGGGHQNAVFCHLNTVNRIGTPLNASKPGYSVSIPLMKIQHFDPNQVNPFELHENFSYLFVLHDNHENNNADIQVIYHKLEYIKATYRHNTTICMEELYDEKIDPFLMPRRLGISIIAK